MTQQSNRAAKTAAAAALVRGGSAQTSSLSIVHEALSIVHDADAFSSDAIAARVQSHAFYFDSILAAIPDKIFHRAADDDDAGGAAARYMKHNRTTDRKLAHKLKHQRESEPTGAEARRVRFDVVNPVAPVTGSKRPRAQDSAHANDSSDDEVEPTARREQRRVGAVGGDYSSAAPTAAASGPHSHLAPTPGGSIDDLRARLHARIKALKGNRGESDAAGRRGKGSTAAAGDHRSAGSGSLSSPGRAGDEEEDAGSEGAEEGGGVPAVGPRKYRNRGDKKDAKKQQQQGAAKRAKHNGSAPAVATVPARAPAARQAPLAAPAGDDFAFGAVVAAGAGAPAGASAGKQGPGKVKRLKSLLAKAQRATARVEADVAAGGATARAEAGFAAAMRRAAGERVLDDPALLAKSLRRAAKAKARSSAEWAERKGAEVTATAARQQERADNLAGKKSRAQAGAAERAEAAKAAARTAAIAAATGRGGNTEGGAAAAGGGGAAARPPAGAAAAKAAGSAPARAAAPAAKGGRPGFEGRGGGGFLNA